jgi:hypothetical protein
MRRAFQGLNKHNYTLKTSICFHPSRTATVYLMMVNQKKFFVPSYYQQCYYV